MASISTETQRRAPGAIARRVPHRAPGWLADSLPSVLVDTEFSGQLRELVNAFEDLAETVLTQVDTIPMLFDADSARPEWLAWLASWTGEDIAGYVGRDNEHLRHVLKTLQQNQPTSGTRRWYESVLAALTGTRVIIVETTTVGGPGDAAHPRVFIHVDGVPRLQEDTLRMWLDRNLPLGVPFELHIHPTGYHPTTPGVPS